MAYLSVMDMHELDTKLVGAVLAQAGLVGWRDVNLVEAAREAELDPGAVRARFPGRAAVLMRFGSLADQEVLSAAPGSGLPREKLFDLVMARFDVLQRHRAGVLAVMEAARFDPGLTLLLGGGTVRSMRWLLEAAGVPATGVVGALRVNGLAAVWAYALRFWQTDESEDLGSVMAAVDRGLDRAMQAEGMVPGHRGVEPPVVELAPETSGGLGGTASVPPSLSGDEILDADDGPAVL